VYNVDIENRVNRFRKENIMAEEKQSEGTFFCGVCTIGKKHKGKLMCPECFRAYEAEAERMRSCLMEFPSKFSYAMNAVKRNIVSCEEELRNLKREREWFENIIAIKQRKKNDKKKMVAVA